MNRKKLEQQKIEQERLRRKKLFQKVIFPSTAAGLVVLLIVTGVIPIAAFHASNNFSPPSQIPWGKFVQISSGNFGTQVNIYFISWYGCPIGAADSWSLYLALSHYGNLSSLISGHYSFSGDSFPDTPGLIFRIFSAGNVNFHPYYVYNQTMSGSPSNSPISGGKLSFGLNELKSELPSPIYFLEYAAMEKVPTSGFNGQSSGIANGHVNTNIIITGPNGAWLLNGPLFSPGVLSGFTPSQVLENISGNQYVVQGSSSISSVIREA